MKTYKSFEEVTKALGFKIKEKPQKEEKEIICKKCGQPMRKHVGGGNVVVCSNSECDNYILWRN